MKLLRLESRARRITKLKHFKREEDFDFAFHFEENRRARISRGFTEFNYSLIERKYFKRKPNYRKK